jgi:multiple sugar transport system ATP-binding protein
MSTVSLKGVGKSYGAVEVLHGIDLEIAEGEFVVLVGPSGCGKSTLLRMICGLEEISKGDVEIGGTRVNQMAPKDRDIAMVFQSYALYPNLTVGKNMAFSLEMRGESKVAIKEKVAEAARMLGLEEYIGRLPKHLSGGQRQRVAMGRAIVRSPQVFLFDEPLSNLDAKMRVQMRAEIKSIHHRLKTTMIYVTHDQIEAMTMADTVVLMNGGNIEQAGTPLELYDTPANKFVAGFIGSPAMNFLDGTYNQNSGKFETAEGDTITITGADDGPASGAATLGIRPEHLILADGSVANTLNAVVTLIEPTGADVHLALDYHGNPIRLVTSERRDVNIGDTITLGIPAAKTHLFDKTTGQRL